MPPIRLLRLDDHVLFREGVSRLLASEKDFEVAAQCGTVWEALEVLARTAIDIVLLDYDLETDVGTRFISAAHAMARAAQPPARALTPRERQVLRGVLEGQTNWEIADSAGTSLSSVKASLQQLFDKTGVRTRGQLVRVAVEQSLETAGSR